jgi:hypothetical protein
LALAVASSNDIAAFVPRNSPARQREIMAEIVAKRLVEHLERSGLVVMKRPPMIGTAAIDRGHEG